MPECWDSEITKYYLAKHNGLKISQSKLFCETCTNAKLPDSSVEWTKYGICSPAGVLRKARKKLAETIDKPFNSMLQGKLIDTP